MIPDPQDLNSGQWTIDGRGLHPFSLAERGPLGGGGGAAAGAKGPCQWAAVKSDLSRCKIGNFHHSDECMY